MKKLMLALAAVATVGVVNAAALDWQYVTNGSTYEGDTVYILKSVADSYANVTELANASVDSDTISKYQSGPTVYYRAGGKNYSHTIANWNAEENGGQAVTFYQVIVHDGKYAVATMSGTTWGGQTAEPANPDGMTKSTFNTWVGTATWNSFENVPEPTSGMLLLLGVAGLALKRKRA